MWTRRTLFQHDGYGMCSPSLQSSEPSPSVNRMPTSDSHTTARMNAIEDRSNRAARRRQDAERQRDMLFGGGCGLVFFGLIPFRSAEMETLGEVSPVMERGFDESTQTLRIMFALLGLLCATLSCVGVPRAPLRWIFPTIWLYLLLTFSVSTARIYDYYTASDLVSMFSRTDFSNNGEWQLEDRVNSLYCKGLIREVCGEGTVEQAKKTFPSIEWPSNSDEQVTVTQACTLDFVIRGPRSLSSGCRLCRQEQVDESDSEVVLAVIKPSPATSTWCGQYLTHRRIHRTRYGAPYRQHRLDVLKNLDILDANRVSSVRLLMVLNWFAIPALTALLWWRCALIAARPRSCPIMPC